MRSRQWWRELARLSAVAFTTAVVWPGIAWGWGGEPLDRAFLTSLTQDAAFTIPHPPEPPRPPDLPMVGGAPDAEGTDADDEPDTAAEPAPGFEAPLALDDPIFLDPRADVRVTLLPGALTVPPSLSSPGYPVIINPSVEALIDYFTARERERFGLWIARSGRYLGMIRRVLRERGLPEELAYTAMIESGFSPRAVSRMGARGLWQFMEATARRYGLVVNRWVDERFDPVKSTIAAAEYLGDLYEMFGHWFLAQAAYNAGEARVGRAIQRARTSDFWALTQTRHLPNETKKFVPQILAATVITREPARYGFEVTMETPLEYEEVAVKRALDLETVGTLAEVPVEQIRELNPALRGGITPPFSSYMLRLPVGTAERFETALRNASPSSLVAWGIHRVAKNQSLAEIARMYRVPPQRLAEINQLSGGRLRGVTELLVPVSNRVKPARIQSNRVEPRPLVGTRARGAG